MNSFGRLVKIARLKKQKTVRALLKQLDCQLSPAYMTKIELHGEIPALHVIHKLCKVLGLSFSEMVQIAKEEKIEAAKRTIEMKFATELLEIAEKGFNGQ